MKKLLIGILCALNITQNAYGNPPIVWGPSNSAQMLTPTISFTPNTTFIMSGTLTPTSSAVSAAKGSLYSSTNGVLYIKQDAGLTTNWTALSGGGVTTIGAIDGQAAAANGAAISGTSIYMQSGDATHPGLINNTTQTISGAKTFSSTIVGSISGNAATVTTNANLTGPITSVGNATSVAAQTGTGSTFVMQNTPTLTTPVIGAATGTSLQLSGLTASQSVVTDSSKNLASLSYTANPTGSTIMSRDINGSTAVTNLIYSSTTTASAGQTITMNYGSSEVQRITGSSTIIFTLPDATTMYSAQTYQFNNNSTGTVTVNDKGGSLVVSVPGGGFTYVINTNNASSNGAWDFHNLLSNASTSGTTGTAVPGTFAAASTVSGTQLISTVSTGTAPLTVASTTQVANLNAATAGVGTLGTTVAVSNSASYFPLFAASSSNGNQAFNLGTGLTFNPSTNNLSTTTFTGALSGNSTTATAATNVAITDDTTTNATMYPSWFTAATGNLPAKVSSTKLTFNPSTAALTTTTFVGALTGHASLDIANTLLTTTGDTIYASSANTPARLAVGTQYQVLQAGATTPTYGAVNLAQAAAVTGALPVANGGTGQITVPLANAALNFWTTGATYAVGQEVTQGANKYVCIVAHTAGGTLAADVALGKWKYASDNAFQSPNLMLTGTTFEDGLVGGWVAVGGGAMTNGLVTTVGSGGTVYISGNGGVAKGANTTAAAITASSPIDGINSLNLATSGAGVIGDGYISQSIPISIAYQAKVLTVKFKYKVASGTPVLDGTSANTYAADVYDVTNNTWLRLVGNFNFVQSTGVGDFVGTVQTASTTAAIQLFVYSPVAPVAASSLLLDNFYIGQQTAPTGPAMSDWGTTAWTPTGAFTTNTTYTGAWKREGDNLLVKVHMAFAGAPNSVSATINLPSGMTIDTAKVFGTVATTTNLGMTTYGDSGVATYAGTVAYSTTTAVALMAPTRPTTYLQADSAVTQAVPFSFGNADYIDAWFSVPIVGWSSNTVQSSDTDTRVVAFKAMAQATGSITTTFTDMVIGTTILDTHSAYASGTGIYTIPVSGTYYIASGAILGGTYALNGDGRLQIYKNNTTSLAVSISRSGGAQNVVNPYVSTVVNLVAGDNIRIQALSTASVPGYDSTTNGTYFIINRLSGPAVISATESVSATYTGTATGSLSAAYNLVTWPTKQKDTHNAYSSGTYTVPVSGTYNISASLDIAAVTFSIANYNALAIQKNGSTINEGLHYTSVGAPSVMPRVSVASYPLVAGDLITIKSYTAATTPSIGGGAAGFSIVRVGN